MKLLGLFLAVLLLFAVNTFATANKSSSAVIVPHIDYIGNYTDLATAVSTIGSTKTTLMINSAQTLTDGSTVTIPSTLTVWFTDGGSIDGVSGRSTETLIINGLIIAGVWQIFGSNIKESFGNSNTKDIFVEWFDDPQDALDASTTNQRVLFNTAITTATGYTITNKSDLEITGNGNITLASANFAERIFDLVGTIDNLRIYGLELVGEGNTAYNQQAIGCASGQTITNVWFENNYIHDINVGITLNANLSGSYDKAVVRGNTLKNIVGKSSGQGYGIHAAKAYNTIISNNLIDNASRHSIYIASGKGLNLTVSDNVITNHRSGVADATYRGAIQIARVSGVTVTGNTVKDFYDCAIYIAPVSSDTADVSDILVSGNFLLNRSNAVASIAIGEQAIPTKYFSKNISIIGNHFYTDSDVSSGGQDMLVFNGFNIHIAENTFHINNPNGYGIQIGHDAYLNGVTHLDYVWIENNSFLATGSNTLSRGIQVDDEVAAPAFGVSSSIHIKDNRFSGTWDAEVYFNSLQTNTGVIWLR